MRRSAPLMIVAGSRWRGAAAGALLALAAGQAGAGDPAQAQVGVPGCADDVAVRAWREPITFDSRGRSIRAHLYTPRGVSNGMGLVLLHGGTGFEMNAILFDAHAIQLASRGYHVILPAYFDAAAPDRALRRRPPPWIREDGGRVATGPRIPPRPTHRCHPVRHTRRERRRAPS